MVNSKQHSYYLSVLYINVKRLKIKKKIPSSTKMFLQTMPV